MKIGFYIPAYEHLGIAYLSACLKEAGHEPVAFLDPLLCKEGFFHTKTLEKMVDMEDYVIDRILEAELDLLAFSVVTGNLPRACRVARKVKERRNTPTVFGGIHCSSVPQRVIEKPEVDYVVVGEGEGALVELADRLDAGHEVAGIANVWHKKDGRVFSSAPRPVIEDLDALPFPDKDLVYSVAPGFFKTHYMTSASRGCLFMCSYCNNSVMRKLYKGKGRWRRRRSVDNIIEELVEAQGKYKYQDVRFWDELFIDDRDWIEEFAQKYPAAVGKPFFCWGHPRFIDEKVVELLEKAGCRELNLGVESIQERTRRELLRRFETNDVIIRAFDIIRSSRIWLSTGNIVGLPGQTVDEVAEMASFYNEHRVDRAWVFFFRHYPNTAIVSTALDRGLLSPEQVDQIEDPTELQVSFSHSNMHDDADIVRLGTVIYMTSLFPPWLVRRLLDSDRWRRIPALSFAPFIAIIAALVKRITTGKRATVEGYPPWRYIQAIIQFAFKKMAWKLRRSSTS